MRVLAGVRALREMPFGEGIDAQPEVLAHSAASVRSSLESVEDLPDRSVVALVGIGASEHIARGAAATWRSLGIKAVALSASDLLAGGAAEIADVYVGLSESGRSAETVTAFRGTDARRIGITNTDEVSTGDCAG